MDKLIAKFILEEQEPIKANFKINLTPSKVSQLENDLDFVRREEVNLPDVDFDKFATKDEVENISTQKVDVSDFETAIEDINIALESKVDDGNVFTQPIKIQNGAGTGTLIVGADVNAGTLTNGTRKLARVAVPTQTNKDLMATLLGFDSNGDDALHIKNKTYDAISFGGQTKITNATSPMSLGFCVTKTRNSTSASDKVYVLEMDSNEARFNVQPNYNGANLATTIDITNALKSYALKSEIPIYTEGENITIENGVISSTGGSVDLTGYIKNKEVMTESIVIGNNTSTAGNAVSIGTGQKVTGRYGIALGADSTLSNTSGISIGRSNTLSGASNIAIGGTVTTSGGNSIGIGRGSCKATGTNALAIGTGAQATGSSQSLAIGYGALATQNNTIQLGVGTNNTADSLQVWDYPLLNKANGKMSIERLPFQTITQADYDALTTKDANILYLIEE